MNRALYIIGIVFSVVFLFFTGYYASEVSSARFFSLYSSFEYEAYSGMLNSSYKDLTIEAALWSLLFFFIYITIDLVGLIKVKTTTTKVFSIIGLSITGVFLLWDLAVMSSPGSMSFDEVSPAWVLYSFIVLAFSIVGLVQSVRFANRKTNGRMIKPTGDLLDN